MHKPDLCELAMQTHAGSIYIDDPVAMQTMTAVHNENELVAIVKAWLFWCAIIGVCDLSVAEVVPWNRLRWHGYCPTKLKGARQ